MKIDELASVVDAESFVLPAASTGAKSAPLFGDLIRAIHRAYGRALQDRIGRFGINIGQWAFLKALWVEDGITQRELSRRVGMMEPTTVTALNVMEQQGQIKRVRDTSDRRKIRIYLTDKARKLRTALMTVSKDLELQAKSSVKEEDLQSAVQVLTRILDNLQNQNNSF